MPFSRNQIWTTVFIYGVSHMFVDAASLVCYSALIRDYSHDLGIQITIFLLYGLIAFATQSPLGLLADCLNRPVLISIAGCLSVAIAPFCVAIPAVALLFVGAGNSLFHVGGGVITLSLAKGRAAIPGFYVAPGTIGVVIGVLLGAEPIETGLFFAPLLLMLSLIILATGPPFWRITNTTRVFCSNSKKPKTVSLLILTAIVLLFLTIMTRSLVSAFLTSPDNDKMMITKNMLLSYTIPAAVFAGKLVGGFLADRLGWRYFVSVVLCLSAILFYISKISIWSIIPAIFLFSMTMPVTLTAISNLLPKFPGFAFGITALGYIAGVFLAMTCSPVAETIAILGFLTVVLFFTGISIYYANEDLRFRLSKW
ncbi:MAG: hypothetical protein LBQ54_13400 [Planctomycetaceae bacterium]|jgi:FSR family fosmidomycin resistance protein-like MFS transporter|nr:hypothetical protein [Planctomycetaceae bacterium]